MLSAIKRWYRPALGRIDCDSWLRLQRILAGDVPTYTASDLLGEGYRVFEWGDGRHAKPTQTRRVLAERLA
jgi:hypothetical protein